LLIPPADYKALLAHSLLGEQMIRSFARQINVAPGIVLGRLQYDGHIGWQQFNRLKVSYSWGHETAEK
jgi:hypothetical protein